MLPLRSRSRSSRRALAAGLPTLAAAAVLAWPCECPDHGGVAHAAHVHGSTAETVASAAHTSHGSHRAPAEAPAAHHRGMGFEVGTAERPIVARGPQGPLWRPTPPAAQGRASHGSFAELAIDAKLDAMRADGSAAQGELDPTATQAALLTTAQATKKLSKTCQRLLKAKKSRLRKADRKRRTTCLAQRRKLVEASKPKPAAAVPAPETPVVQGPKPTTAPPAPTTQTPGTTEQVPTPTTPTSTTPAPREKVYAAAGIRPTDSDPAKWILTRTTATADVVNFELDNTDRQVHNLWIAPGNAAGDVTGPLVEVIGDLEPSDRKAVDVALKPGIYLLICTIPNHDAMKVKFTVFAPAA